MNSDEVKVKYHVRERSRIALMISCYQPNRLGSDLLRIALDSMIRFKTADASIWVIDVGSPKSEFLVTPDEYPTVNFVITDFTPRSWQSTPPTRRLIKQILGFQAPRAGSFAHGWTLDFGIRSFRNLNYEPEYFMTLETDVMFTKKTLLESMIELFDDNTAAVGVRAQKSFNHSEDILQPLGCLWNTKKFFQVGCSFQNKLPQYDVGEKVIVEAKNVGMNIKSLRNTYKNKAINQLIKNDEIKSWHIDKVLDKNDDLVFLHLGRGITQAEDGMQRKININDWISIYKNLIDKKYELQ